MNIAGLVDLEVMQHLAMYGSIKNADPMVQHLLKTSDSPVLRFRRAWMRREALRQHLEAEKDQKRKNEAFRAIPRQRGASVQQGAVVNQFLADEMRHYGKASWNDKEFLGAVKREAPKIFPERESV